MPELENFEGITVWGQEQEVLENQALVELENFAKESKSLHQSDKESKLEEGEIIDESEPQSKCNTLNVEAYIKRQEELRKIQEYRKSLIEKTNAAKSSKPDVKNLPESKSSGHVGKKAAKSKPKRAKRVRRTSSETDDISGSEYVPSDEPESGNKCTYMYL